jgi:hypothetical protein
MLNILLCIQTRVAWHRNEFDFEEQGTRSCVSNVFKPKAACAENWSLWKGG